jgi:outer membrane protein assembly factor BamB
LPTRWSTTQNVRWKADIPGEGWSSPVVVGDRVYLTTAVAKEKTHALHALALDAETGVILWNVAVFDDLLPRGAKIHGKNSHASPTPICEHDRLYVHFGTHGTACLNLQGEILWKTRAIEYSPQHGSGGSPVLVDGLLAFSCDGADVQFVVALDASNGKLRWKKERPPTTEIKRFAFATPLVIDVAGQSQIVSPGAHSVVAYEPQTGDEIWHVAYTGYSVVPRPVFGNGLVYLSTSFDSSVLYAIRPDGHGDVTETHVAWKQSRSAPYTPSPLLLGDDLYIVNDAGIVSCLDASTGKPRWTHRVGGKFSASPMWADGKIYLQSENGETIVFRPGKARFDEVAKNKLEEQSLATPAVLGRSLLIRTASKLYRIEE